MRQCLTNEVAAHLSNAAAMQQHRACSPVLAERLKTVGVYALTQLTCSEVDSSEQLENECISLVNLPVLRKGCLGIVNGVNGMNGVNVKEEILGIWGKGISGEKRKRKQKKGIESEPAKGL